MAVLHGTMLKILPFADIARSRIHLVWESDGAYFLQYFDTNRNQIGQCGVEYSYTRRSTYSHTNGHGRNNWGDGGDMCLPTFRASCHDL